MAIMSEYNPLFQATQIFKERCLIEDYSILWPEQRVWTVSNLQQWKRFFIDQPNLEDMSFKEKLELQLANAPAILWALAADMHYVYYMPSASILKSTKIDNIKWAARNSGLPTLSDEHPMWDYLTKGFVTTGQKYNFRYAQLHLLAIFALRIKENGNVPATLANPKLTQALLDELLESIPTRGDRAYDFRHALLYLLYPDKYEAITNSGARQKIVTHYADLISSPNGDMEDKLFEIRQGLIRTRNFPPDFHYYKEIREEWDPQDNVPPPPPPTVARETTPNYGSVKNEGVIKKALRLLVCYKNIILYGPPGTGKTYLANKIARELISAQLGTPLSRSAFLQSKMEGLTFFEVIALHMYLAGQDNLYSVPALAKMELLKARFLENPVKAPTNQLWRYLQSHTSHDSSTVNLTLREEPYLFDKTTDSKWYLTQQGKNYVSEALSGNIAGIRQGPPQTNQPEAFIRWVTFHQSYAYEDFVEGLRPVTEGGDNAALAFELKQGAFRNICARAKDDPNNKYVLVIDEINRGNIAKIFGELMTLIEADKREVLTIELPYSNELFTVPKNLMIIGTMNTADRSIALLDVALRRRFAFIEILPEADLLDQITITLPEEDVLNIGALLHALNQRIVELRGSDYQIGHSYFLPLKDMPNEADKLASLDDIWNYQIIPLLKEYFYGQADILRKVLPSFFEQDDLNLSPISTGPKVLHVDELVSALNKLKD